MAVNGYISSCIDSDPCKDIALYDNISVKIHVSCGGVKIAFNDIERRYH